MPNITLEDIRQAAEAKYGSTTITVKGGNVELVNPIRLSKQDRDQLSGLDDIELEPDEKVDRIIEIAAKTPAQAKRLIDALDLAERAVVVEMWTKGSQVGEASPSPS